MKTLFGMPIDSLMQSLLVIVSIFLLIVIMLAVRNPIIARIAVRNIFRRWTQSLLMIGGLTLSTIMITSAVGIGDTLAYSTRHEAVQRLGQIDVQITAPGAAGSLLSESDYTDLRAKLQQSPNIDGVAPVLSRAVSIIAPDAGQGAPMALVYGIDDVYEATIGRFSTNALVEQPLSQLAADEVYLNAVGAAALNVKSGDQLELYASEQPTPVRVKAIIRNTGLPANQPVVVLPLDRAQALYKLPQQLSAIVVSTASDVEASTAMSDAVTTQLRLIVGSPERAAHIKSLLSTPQAAAAMATASQALNDELPPRARLMGLAAALQAELAKPGLSDQFRSLLADDELRAWLEPLAFADHDRLTLANELATLSRLQVIDVKARVLAKAESDGSQFMLIFLIMGTFSIMVGMLLVFLLFVMLAAERQSEMGMARAVGLQRGHLIQMFLTEGMVYELIAGVIGVALGIGLSRLMVVFLAEAFAQVEDAGFGRQILFQITLPSIVVALCLGLVLTTLTVAFSAWRISRMNIIAAIRDVPADAPQTSWISRLVALSRVALILFLGAGAVAGGYTGNTLPLVYFGLSVIIIGAGLLLAWIAHLTPFHRRTLDRVVYTLAGTALMSLWLVPGMDRLLGISDFAQGPSIFIFSGVFLILGAIWVLMYNLDVLLSAISGSLSRSGRLAPILKMAVAYPLVSKFRTGVAMAMFSLIIFTIVMVSSITSTQDSVYEDLDAFTGGYQVVAQINGDNRIGDLKAAAQQASGVDAAALEMVSGVARQSVEARQVGAQRRVVSALFAPDASYYERVPSHMRLKMRTSEFATDQAVWEAMQTRDDVALLTRLNVRSGTSPNGEPGGAFVLTSTAYIEDSVLPPAEIEMRLPGTEQTRTVKIIGVIDSYAVPMNGIYTNAATMQTLTGRTLAPSLYMINVRTGADATAIAQQLEKAFLTDGLDVSTLDRQIKSLQEGDKVVFNLFKGFLALGLVIGVAALGVISSRNVIERRQQIGMLRAIGFNSNMVQLSFMVEASIIALLGLFLGSTLGLVLGANITADIARGQPGVTFNPEWGHLALILAAAYFFSLLTTYLPARRAARIYPAEALRYE